MRRVSWFLACSALVLVSDACAGRVVAPAPDPMPVPVPPKPVDVVPPVVPPVTRTVARASVPAANPKLPPVPAVNGPLRIAVVYPPKNALLGARDSNFVFGSVGNGTAGLRINGTLVPVWPNGAFLGWVANPSVGAQYYELVAYTATDTVRWTHPIRTRAAQPPVPEHHDTIVPVTPAQVAVLRDDSLEHFVNDTDCVIIGRPSPAGTYRWFLFPGTPVRVTGYLRDKARVALDDAQEIWVDRRNVKHVSAPSSTQTPSIGAAQYIAELDWIDVRIPAPAPPAYIVNETEYGLTLTLYATSASSRTTSAVDDPYLKPPRVDVRASRTTYHFDLKRPVYGYLALYRDGIMTFRIRRPPRVDAEHPLRGLTIAVDPGHPPIGATGPTGLYEPVPTLAVGVRVRDMLIAQGAHVIMTRTSPDPVALGDRPIIARRANANALVSIHLNALPDGMNPFRMNGTGTYYFHTHAERYATLVQQSLIPELGLRDLGTFRENLALARPTWMPAVLTEGVFIIMPDQEAAIRTSQYQDAYARGIVTGLARFFSTFAQ